MSYEFIEWATRQPKILAPLDRTYMPIWLVNQQYQRVIENSTDVAHVEIALEQPGGVCFRSKKSITAADADTPLGLYMLEHHIKRELYGKGGNKLSIVGPMPLVNALKWHYLKTKPGIFDADMMGQAFGEDFLIHEVESADKLPPAFASFIEVHHGQRDGNYIGFDAGGSNTITVAVKNGKVIYQHRELWDPYPQTDIWYHAEFIEHQIYLAADALDYKIDGLVVDSAGIYRNNQAMVASLFRSVDKTIHTDWRNIYINAACRFNTKLRVINDGEISALAGANQYDAVGGSVAVTLGTSTAGGCVTPEGKLTHQLNEYAFIPATMLDPFAPSSSWSSYPGEIAYYLSQQSVARLAPLAGININPEMPEKEQLLAIQKMANESDPRAISIFETIGVYLGYFLLDLADWQKFHNVFLLGRGVMGEGGKLMVNGAKGVIEAETPDLANTIRLVAPEDDESAQFDQAKAAASIM